MYHLGMVLHHRHGRACALASKPASHVQAFVRYYYLWYYSGNCRALTHAEPRLVRVGGMKGATDSPGRDGRGPERPRGALSRRSGALVRWGQGLAARGDWSSFEITISGDGGASVRFHADVGRRGVRAGRPTTKTTAPGGAAPPPACPRGTATADAAAPTGKALKNLRHVRRGALGRILKRDGHIRALASAAFAHWRALPPPAPPAVADAAAAADAAPASALPPSAGTDVPAADATPTAAAVDTAPPTSPPRPWRSARVATRARDSPNREPDEARRSALRRRGPEPGFDAFAKGL